MFARFFDGGGQNTPGYLAGMTDNKKCEYTFSVDVIHSFDVWERSIADHPSCVDDCRGVRNTPVMTSRPPDPGTPQPCE